MKTKGRLREAAAKLMDLQHLTIVSTPVDEDHRRLFDILAALLPAEQCTNVSFQVSFRPELGKRAFFSPPIHDGLPVVTLMSIEDSEANRLLVLSAVTVVGGRDALADFTKSVATVLAAADKIAIRGPIIQLRGDTDADTAALVKTYTRALESLRALAEGRATDVLAN